MEKLMAKENETVKIADLKELLANAGNREKALTAEVKAAVANLIVKMTEARAEGLVAFIGLDNGEQTGAPELTVFRMIKVVDQWQKPQPTQQDNMVPAGQGPRRG
jgi:hypothetical protein